MLHWKITTSAKTVYMYVYYTEQGISEQNSYCLMHGFMYRITEWLFKRSVCAKILSMESVAIIIKGISEIIMNPAPYSFPYILL